MIFNIFFLRKQIPFISVIFIITAIIIYIENYRNGGNNESIENMIYIFLNNPSIPFPNEIKDAIDDEVISRDIHPFLFDYFSSKYGYNKHYKYYRSHPQTSQYFLYNILEQNYVKLLMARMDYHPEYAHLIVNELKLELRKLTVHMYTHYLCAYKIDFSIIDDTVTGVYKKLNQLKTHYHRVHLPKDRMKRIVEPASKNLYDLNGEVSRVASAITERMPVSHFNRLYFRLKRATKRSFFVDKFKKIFSFRRMSQFYHKSQRKKNNYTKVRKRSYISAGMSRRILFRLCYKYQHKFRMKYKFYKFFVHRKRGFSKKGNRIGRRNRYYW
jgi:hypothetical protein